MKNFTALATIISLSIYQIGIVQSQQLSPSEAYQDAVKKTHDNEPEPISSMLTPINLNNRVQLAHFFYCPPSDSLETCNSDLQQKIRNRNAHEITELWVTVFPKLQEFCSQISNGIDLKLQVEQLLGLPPGNKNAVAEISADPIYLLRPSLDPEITDTTTLPVISKEVNVSSNSNFHFPVYVSQEYRDWFIRKYHDINYPFTGLGYTYDWNPEAKNNIGLSEFVIWLPPLSGNLNEQKDVRAKEARGIEVVKIYSLNAFCGRK